LYIFCQPECSYDLVIEEVYNDKHDKIARYYTCAIFTIISLKQTKNAGKGNSKKGQQQKPKPMSALSF